MAQYQIFRDALMGMKSLHHLCLNLECFPCLPPSSSPIDIILPTVRALELGCIKEEAPYTIYFLQSIHAASLRSLSLDCGAGDYNSLGHRFPSLTSLTLGKIPVYNRFTLAEMARRFPDIEHLTCYIRGVDEDEDGFGIDHVIGKVLWGSNDPLWPKVHTIAVNVSGRLMTGCQLTENIITLQKLGHPIRKLLLPRAILSQVQPSLKEVVDLNEFSNDFLEMTWWPER
ncbi:hypothetical protein FIBSPDRAFT_959835 [Athelia psychrophila]|uniref:F-box domain-containing protein n=1 Tax=Athelia psychrophila TaxID=1759441 RepID=A0A166D2K2_9AGAM|nr:hypothetical protein FIBSPDRAFT_959835 [Fibularhizoctonia sp. CBS 109695]